MFGVQVNTWGVNDLVAAVDAVPDADIDALVAEYEDVYDVVPDLRAGGERHKSLRYGARIELGLRSFLDGRRVRRVHHQLRGPRRPAAAARPGRAAADGRRVRVRRRGRLEDRDPGPRRQGHGRGPARRRLLHGGLHLRPHPGRRADPRRPHARGLPHPHHRPPPPGDPPAVHRRPRRPRPARLHRRPRPRRRRRPVRHARPVPARRQRRRGRPAVRPAAPAARRPRRLEARSPTSPPPRPPGSPPGRRTTPSCPPPSASRRSRTTPAWPAPSCSIIDAATTARAFEAEIRANAAYYRLARGI